MSMMTNTLGRYFAGRFVVSALGVFASIFVLLVLVDYIEMVRKTSGLVSASAITVAETSLFRVPQLLEKMMPFCILIAGHRAGAGKRGRARNSGDHRLQPDVRQFARTLQADGSGAVRLCSRRRHTGRIRLLDQSGEQ
jgi:hypothetical protein